MQRHFQCAAVYSLHRDPILGRSVRSGTVHEHAVGFGDLAAVSVLQQADSQPVFCDHRFSSVGGYGMMRP